MSERPQHAVPTSTKYRLTSVGAICDEHGGEVQTGPFGSQLHAADYSDHGTPVVMPQDMRDGRIVCDRIARVANRHVQKLDRHVLRQNDLVFSRRGDVSRFAVVTEVEDGWLCGTGSIRIRMNSPDVYIGYARRYLQQESVGAWLLREAQGITMPNLNTKIIRALPFLVPPLPEQRRIAEILDTADALRTKRRAVIAQLDQLTQAIFIDMFGDPVANPKNWVIKRMSELFASTPIFGTMIPGDAEGGEFLCLRVANIQDWQLALADKKYVDLPSSMIERHSVRDGDLLMARAIATQEHLGKCIVARPGNAQWAFDSHLMRVRFAPDQALPDFIREALRTPGGRSIFLKASRKSSVQYNINTKEMSALALPIPPFSLQQTFAMRIQFIEELKAKHRAALALDNALFTSLQHRAFNGELTTRLTAAKPKPHSFAELDELNTTKGLEALVYATRRLPGKGHYWPLKAQYLADRRHLERYGRTVYGETHVAMPYGPVPQAAFNASRALANDELICELPMDAVRAALRRDGDSLVALRDADMEVLNADERESLDWAIRQVTDLSFEALKTQTHDAAYEATPRNAPMAWRDIIESLAPAARQRLLSQFE